MIAIYDLVFPYAALCSAKDTDC